MTSGFFPLFFDFLRERLSNIKAVSLLKFGENNFAKKNP